MRAIALLVTAACLLPADQAEFFETRIRPVLAKNCLGCHGDKLQMANMSLASAAEFAKVDRQRLLAALSYDGKIKMPPAGKLAPEALNDLTQWIHAGAEWPKTVAAGAREETHWAFVRPAAIQPPAVRNESWIRTPVDRFVLAKLEAKGIAPAESASRRTLLRRVTYDLTGLPPTPSEISPKF